MTELPHITKSPENVSCSLDGDNAFAPMSVRCRRVMVDYLSDLLTPALNQLRAAYGIEPEPLRPGLPVTAEEAKAAAEALRAEQAEAELAEWKALMEAGAEKPRRQHKPRRPTLAKVAEQFRKAHVDAS